MMTERVMTVWQAYDDLEGLNPAYVEAEHIYYGKVRVDGMTRMTNGKITISGYVGNTDERFSVEVEPDFELIIGVRES